MLDGTTSVKNIDQAVQRHTRAFTRFIHPQSQRAEEVTLDIDDLANEALEPTWFYFYKARGSKLRSAVFVRHADISSHGIALPLLGT